MRVFSATVRDGAIVTDGDVELPEGASVTVVMDSDEQSFVLGLADEDELAERIAEADRGEVVPAAELLRRLAR